MITNRSPYWIRVMADLETEDPLFVRSHVSAEFLEATCTDPSCEPCANGSAAKDPFVLTPAEQSALTVKPTLQQQWDGLTATIARADPCPVCGERPWWSYQDSCVSWQQEEDETLDEMYGFK